MMTNRYIQGASEKNNSRERLEPRLRCEILLEGALRDALLSLTVPYY